jgi:hypothetical protein
MTTKRLVIDVIHSVQQRYIIEVPEDELETMSYEDAIANCEYDPFQPSLYDTEITHVTVDDKEHYF